MYFSCEGMHYWNFCTLLFLIMGLNKHCKLFHCVMYNLSSLKFNYFKRASPPNKSCIKYSICSWNITLIKMLLLIFHLKFFLLHVTYSSSNKEFCTDTIFLHRTIVLLVINLNFNTCSHPVVASLTVYYFN